jgi:hypothetical protein
VLFEPGCGLLRAVAEMIGKGWLAESWRELELELWMRAHGRELARELRHLTARLF